MRGRTSFKLLSVVRIAIRLGMAIVIMVLMLANYAAVVLVKFVASCMCVLVSHGLTANEQ